MDRRIITRREWGARPPDSTTALNASLVTGVVVHHTETSCCGVETAEFSTVAGALRAIQEFHMRDRGWSDIAYNFAVDQRGVIYELRGWGVRSAANGNSTTNSAYPAIVAMGSYGAVEPTNEMLGSIAWLIAEYRDRFPGIQKTLGHRDVRSTSCPGQLLYAKLSAVDFISKWPRDPQAYVPGYPTLSLGSEGPWVERLQSTLNETFASRLANDGDFGAKTLSAVRSFNQALRDFWKVPVVNLEVFTPESWRWLDWFHKAKTG